MELMRPVSLIDYHYLSSKYYIYVYKEQECHRRSVDTHDITIKINMRSISAIIETIV